MQEMGSSVDSKPYSVKCPFSASESVRGGEQLPAGNHTAAMRTPVPSTPDWAIGAVDFMDEQQEDGGTSE